jgi:hypothetical protein
MSAKSPSRSWRDLGRAALVPAVLPESGSIEDRHPAPAAPAPKSRRLNAVKVPSVVLYRSVLGNEDVAEMVAIIFPKWLGSFPGHYCR